MAAIFDSTGLENWYEITGQEELEDQRSYEIERAQDLAFLGKALVLNETVEETFTSEGGSLVYEKTVPQSFTISCRAEVDEVVLSRLTMAYQELNGVGQSVTFNLDSQGNIKPLASDQDGAIEAISSKFEEVLSKVRE